MSILAILAAHAAGGPVDPDPDPPGEMWGTGTTADPIYIPEGSLDGWRAKLRDVDTDLATAMVYGDSTLAFGQPLDGNPKKGPISIFMSNLATIEGYPFGGDGITGVTGLPTDETAPYTMTYAPIKAAEVMSWSGSTFTPHGIGLNYDGRATIQGTGTRIRIHYYTSGGINSHFTYSVDGGPEVTVTATGTDLTYPSGDPRRIFRTIEAASGLTPGLHEIEVKTLNGKPFDTTLTQATPLAQASSLPAGTYYYKITRYDPDRDVETAGSPNVMSATVDGSEVVRLRTVKSNDSLVPARIYRATSEAGPFLRVAEAPVTGGGITYVYDDGTGTGDGSPVPTEGTMTHGGDPVVHFTTDFTNTTGLLFHRLGGQGSGVAGGTDAKVDRQFEIFQPTLVMGGWGVNNMNTDPAVIRAATEVFIDKIHAYGADALILLPHLPDLQYAGATPTREALKAAALAKGVGWVDLGARGALGPEEEWSSKGYHSGMHPGATAHSAMADYLWPVLSAGIDPPA